MKTFLCTGPGREWLHRELQARIEGVVTHITAMGYASVPIPVATTKDTVAQNSAQSPLCATPTPSTTSNPSVTFVRTTLHAHQTHLATLQDFPLPRITAPTHSPARPTPPKARTNVTHARRDRGPPRCPTPPTTRLLRSPSLREGLGWVRATQVNHNGSNTQPPPRLIPNRPSRLSSPTPFPPPSPPTTANSSKPGSTTTPASPNSRPCSRPPSARSPTGPSSPTSESASTKSSASPTSAPAPSTPKPSTRPSCASSTSPAVTPTTKPPAAPPSTSSASSHRQLPAPTPHHKSPSRPIRPSRPTPQKRKAPRAHTPGAPVLTQLQRPQQLPPPSTLKNASMS